MSTQKLSPELNEMEILKGEIEQELDQTCRSLDELNLMLEQSQLEVTKLARRNAAAIAQLQQVQGRTREQSPEELRVAYDNALETQQRLFIMRGQVEKLQSDKGHLDRYAMILEKVNGVIDRRSAAASLQAERMDTAETVEMMVKAQEAERQRLSRQMHDGPVQALSNFILQSEIAMRLFDIDQNKAREELVNLKTSATSTFQKIRDFIFELRPMMLDDLGLKPTIQRYIESYKNTPGLDVQLSITGGERRLENYREIMIFRAIQELMNNAIRHSQATQIGVQLDLGETNIKVVVEDNGKGFDTGILENRVNMGIKLIKERVELLGGSLEVDSLIGQGTRVSFLVPAAS